MARFDRCEHNVQEELGCRAAEVGDVQNGEEDIGCKCVLRRRKVNDTVQRRAFAGFSLQRLPPGATRNRAGNGLVHRNRKQPPQRLAHFAVAAAR
ncbi:unnamed protein product, partial [Symbiodinium sp. KB8]